MALSDQKNLSIVLRTAEENFFLCVFTLHQHRMIIVFLKAVLRYCFRISFKIDTCQDSSRHIILMSWDLGEE